MATTPKVTLHPDAYTVLFLHCCKHPHRALNGLLLGSATSDSVTVTEALPLFHSSLALAPMLEAALLLAEEYCKQRSSKSSPFQIVGYYQANELVTDHELGPFGKKVCEKIRAQSPATAVLLLDGESMRPSPTDLRLSVLGADGRRTSAVPQIADDRAAQCIDQLEQLIERGVATEIVDFDVHLDEPTKDWLGNASILK